MCTQELISLAVFFVVFDSMLACHFKCIVKISITSAHLAEHC